MIREIESKIFLEDEIKPQVQYSKQIFRYFEEEIRYLEEWLKKDTCDKECIEFVHSTDSEKQNRVPYISGMDEEEMQQLMDNNNQIQQRSSSMYQQKDSPEKVIDEMRMLMMKVPRRRYI